MAGLFSPKESKVSQIAMAKKEIEEYLNAGKSLKRWEYFIKCITRNPSPSSNYRNADLKDDLIKMARFQPGEYKVLQRILDKYGMNVFMFASVNVFTENRDYPYFKEAYGVKVLVRA
ncbi:MAG TPA: hypothetical protein VNF06_00880 [Candidatus Aquilonibacter sp.]|nr:hypothetical protein [Candidatus Aquilonibacter sp.]